MGGAESLAIARFEIAVQIESGVRSEVGATGVGLAGGGLVRAAGGGTAVGATTGGATVGAIVGATGGATGGATSGVAGGAIGGVTSGAAGVDRIGAELESGI